MPEVQCSQEARNYIDGNHELIPDVWSALLQLLDAEEPIGIPYEDQHILITPHHEIFYEWVSADVKLVTVIKPY
ncbi:MAG: hypothetical protein KDE53_08300 [Caldilineaceae bacterium]|nr:hypothetical protein [Caldilineaceae bacterium]